MALSEGIRIKLQGPIVNGKGDERLKQVISQTFDKILPILRTEVMKKTPVGVSGHLRAGVSYKKQGWHKGIIYEKGSGKKYVEVVERGRRPGQTMPPPKPIRKWLRLTDKGQDFVAFVKEKYGLPKMKTLKLATFLKQKAIAKYGIEKVEMFKKTGEERRRWIVREFGRALGRF